MLTGGYLKFFSFFLIFPLQSARIADTVDGRPEKENKMHPSLSNTLPKNTRGISVMGACCVLPVTVGNHGDGFFSHHIWRLASHLPALVRQIKTKLTVSTSEFCEET